MRSESGLGCYFRSETDWLHLMNASPRQSGSLRVEQGGPPRPAQTASQGDQVAGLLQEQLSAICYRLCFFSWDKLLPQHNSQIKVVVLFIPFSGLAFAFSVLVSCFFLNCVRVLSCRGRATQNKKWTKKCQFFSIDKFS